MENFYHLVETKSNSFNPNKGKSHELELPFRVLVVGASGVGKSNCVLNLIKVLSRPKPTLSHVYLYCKSKDEPLYDLLEKKLKNNITICENGEVIPLDDLERNGEQLVIFDDLVGDKAATAKAIEYFKRARKMGISCAFLSQSYFKTDKFIRSNCSHLIIKKIATKRDLRQILSEYPIDIDIDELKTIYNRATAKFEDVLIMDLLHNKLYHNFKHLII